MHMELSADEDDLPQRALLGIQIRDNNASCNVVLSALLGELPSAKLRTLIYHCRVSLDQSYNIMTIVRQYPLLQPAL